MCVGDLVVRSLNLKKHPRKNTQADIRKGTLSFKTHLTQPQGKLENRKVKLKSEEGHRLPTHQKTGTATDYCVDLL